MDRLAPSGPCRSRLTADPRRSPAPRSGRTGRSHGGTYEYKVEELREGMIGGKMSGGKLEKVLNENAREGWQLKAITSVEVKGRIGPGGVRASSSPSSGRSPEPMGTTPSAGSTSIATASPPDEALAFFDWLPAAAPTGR